MKDTEIFAQEDTAIQQDVFETVPISTSIKLEVEKEELRLILKSLAEQGKTDLFEKLNKNLERNKIFLNINNPPMSYKDFVTLEMVLKQFKLKGTTIDLFPNIVPIEESKLSFFRAIMERNKKIPKVSEKARSEIIILPLLSEVLEQSKKDFLIFSGKTFKVDSDKGLTGRCDFLLSATGSAKHIIYAPVFAAVEAKQKVLEDYTGQCAAEMVAARIFNAKNDREIDAIYGLVTSGTEWLFMKLEGDTIYIDDVQYYENEFDKIIAILQHIVEESIA